MSAPDKSDAPTYRGKTLTPESPRPLHIPEPANIPVLENQIDPVFNLMSTHMSIPQSARNMTAMDQQITEQGSNDQINVVNAESDNGAIAEKRTDASESSGVEVGRQNYEFADVPKSDEAMLAQTESSNVQDQTSSLNNQPAAPMASSDDLPASISNPQANPSIQMSATESQDPTDALQPTQQTSQTDVQITNTNETDQKASSAEEKEESNANMAAGGDVNYQALLDNIVPTNTEDAPGNNVPNENHGDAQNPSSASLPTPNLAASASLPPRPPPQEKPAIHPNYVPGEDIRSYHYPHLHNNGSNSGQPTQSPQQTTFLPQPTFPPSTTTGSNGLPPPPLASFQQPLQSSNEQMSGSAQHKAQLEANRKNKGARNDEGRWAKEVQQLYDQFLDDEAVYTAEGTWDKFPQGSRLFVGNLPTEVVTKRDIFHIFYRYGRLAQISIKQAYGFVQFMDTESSYEALRSEQNGKIKDRNMHLEISKPPKNSRNAQPSAAGERLRAGYYRRSRSPDRRPGSRDTGRGVDQYRGGRDEPRRRDDYRPRRSPSPRGFRGRDSYRGGRSPDRYAGGRDRSRSPYGRYRGSSPQRRRSYDEDDNLPMRRRGPGEVPELQLIVMEDLDRTFVQFLEKHFRDSGLKVAVMQMPPQASIEAVIKRQVLEGVQAIIRLTRGTQLTARMPVQLFDRSSGGAQARFENYDDLSAEVAAALINRNKQKQPPVLPQSPFGAAPPPYGAPLPAQAMSQQAPNLSNLFTQLDGATLQKLASALQNTPQTPQSAVQSALQSPSHNPDLAALLASAGHGPTPIQNQPRPGAYPYQQQHQIPSQQQQQQQQHQFAAYPNFGQPSMPPAQQHQQAPPQQQHTPQQMNQPYQYQPGGPQPAPHQVQDIMQQLAKYNRQ